MSNFYCLPGKAGGSPMILARVGDFGPPVEAGLALDLFALGGESGASHRDDLVESLEGGDVLVDDGLVDQRPQRFSPAALPGCRRVGKRGAGRPASPASPRQPALS